MAQDKAPARYPRMQNANYPPMPPQGYPPPHGYPPPQGYGPPPGGYTPAQGYPARGGYPPPQGYPPAQGYGPPGPAQGYVHPTGQNDPNSGWMSIPKDLPIAHQDWNTLL
ncbi:hypothetical protein QE152_g33127 [Popillia japonica]|uniref:Rhodopsin n=1 Tax=Popillia japonica TaxID=7064 RepID=A0AAW1IXF5_POPJA